MLKSVAAEYLTPIQVLEEAFVGLQEIKGSTSIKFNPPALSAPIKQERSHGGTGELMTDGAAMFFDATYVPTEHGAWWFSLGKVHYVSGGFGSRKIGIYGSRGVMPHFVGSMRPFNGQPVPGKDEQLEYTHGRDRKQLAETRLDRDCLVVADYPFIEGIGFTGDKWSQELKKLIGPKLPRPVKRTRVSRSGEYLSWEYESRCVIDILLQGMLQIAAKETKYMQEAFGGYLG